ncbi:MAG: aldehyde dehydrogenase [Anaerolineaceae bacterium 4572_78]|nr:MAG: aldehyde dehydrogenase [Anaerolineaceae bacterium 4572_78]
MKMLFNGEWVDLPEKRVIRNPQDGSEIDTVPLAGADVMKSAIDYAVEGFERSRKMPTHQRISILQKAADLIQERHEEFSQTLAKEGIKTISEARKEVTRCIETIRISAEESRRIVGKTIPFDQMPGSENRFGYYIRMPIGIIGAITPFNDPLNLVAHKVGPAIASGNAIIVKPHSHTPLSALLLAEVIHEAGIPPAILQVITGRGSIIGDVLVTDPRVRMISFTGGRGTGEDIMKRVGLKKIGMELGSNSPVIVMDDCDMKLAVESSVSGAFWAAGQNCLHAQRIIIHDSIYDEFSKLFIAATKAYKVGDKLDESTDMGPIVNDEEATRVENMVKEAIDKGATLLTGGKRKGTFYDPTVLENIPDTCSLASDEVYGPVCTFHRFKTLDEAIDIANSVDFGLQSAIFTNDLKTAIYASHELQCGGVMVNDSTDYRIDAMPFGGIKGSGLGREGIEFAVHEMTEPKVVCFNL